ncbi:TfoX/Sxy family protein [Gymnodinialimonas hymeniacidonis]|uniref:TfoX/Sxy family protein n=1 Tax=Gymnodinialimonas hymeniacidonis TaxID=3126508 RepID=UPI0034C5CA3D
MTQDKVEDDLTSIRNIGPALAETLTKAGIKDAKALRSLGAHEAYRLILRTGIRAHFITYYVLEMSLQGRAWNDCKGAEKDALRAKFDQLKQEEAGPGADTEVERVLNLIGTGRSR